MWDIVEISPGVRPYDDRIRVALDIVRRRIAVISELQPIRFRLEADRTRALEFDGFGAKLGSALTSEGLAGQFDTTTGTSRTVDD